MNTLKKIINNKHYGRVLY